jgi:hypothetical protein
MRFSKSVEIEILGSWLYLRDQAHFSDELPRIVALNPKDKRPDD